VTRLRHARRADHRSAAAAALSFLFPGLGQGYNRQWLLAAVLAAPALLVVLLAVSVPLLGGSGAFARLLDSRVLVALIVLNVALLGWRLIAIVQAHVGRDRLRLDRSSTWFTAVLVVLTLGMHAVPTFYAARAIEALDTIALEGGGSLFDERGGRDVEIAVPTFQPEIGERVTVLLAGVDFAPGRTQHLTDTLLVATLDPRTDDVAMISIPRDLYGVPLGDGRVYNAKLNSLLATADADAVTYPRGGPGTLKAAVGELLGIQIHYFAAIDIEGMRQLIDAVGGVDVVVEHAIRDPHYRDSLSGRRGFRIEAGPQHLDGDTAMAFVRSRMAPGENDFTRAERQQTVLTAIGRDLTAGNLLAALPSLLDTVRDNVSTDVPSNRIPEVAAAVQDANLGTAERVVLTPDDGYVTVDAHSASGYVLYPNLDAIRALAARIVDGTADGVQPGAGSGE
jgi:polyisoprenyl-teichoic acid--peptidoglycan teichoic acid transferase